MSMVGASQRSSLNWSRDVLLLGLLPLCMLLTLAGCNKQDLGERRPLKGKVTLKGQPLNNGTIQFSGTGTSKGSAGALIENGEYTVPAEYGLDPGSYDVRISSGDAKEVDTSVPPGESGPPAKERIPPEYNVKTKQKVEVKADAENNFDFAIP